jgi:co-chaperonin GroES (HSP10)
MLKNLKPLYNQVLVKPIEQGEQRRGAIMIANLDQDSTTKIGEVIAIGPGQYEFGVYVTPTVKVGDIVVLPKIGAQRVIVDGGEELYIIACKEIIATAEYTKD